MVGDYISREAAISKIRDEGVLGGDYDAYEREEDVVNTLNSIPAADVVEVVQCRECRHAAPNGLDIKCNKHSGSTKSKLGGEISYIELHKPHFFCADGKRMGGGQDDV